VIRVLCVDDSALMRKLLAKIFASEDDVEVAFARDGVEALAQLHELKPDVITLDVQMPRMDGLACLDRIMVERPCPVVMFSALTGEGTEQTLEALSLGAVDFVLKPGGAISLKLDEFGPDLIETVRVASRARVSKSHRLAERVQLRTARAPTRRQATTPAAERPNPSCAIKGERLVLVGSSTGGPPALDAVLGSLPADFPWPVVVAQHIPGSFTAPLARRLDGFCALSVTEVSRPTRLIPGNVYIGRGDADVLVSLRNGELIALSSPSNPVYRWHPSVDRLVDSAISALGAERVIGVLMTGMGNDGAAAMRRAYDGGARTIAEAEETAVVWGMPGELVHAGGAEFVEPLDAIADRLIALASE